MDMSIAYIAGIICGVFCVGLAIVLMRLIFKKIGWGGSDCLKGKYDERQKLLQGQGYKLGFYAMMISGILYSSLDTFMDLPILPIVGMWACIMIGLGSFACFCIIKDAYLGIGTKKKAYICLSILIIFANMISFFMNGFDAVLDEDKLGVGCINLMCAILFAVILIAFGVREILNRKED